MFALLYFWHNWDLYSLKSQHHILFRHISSLYTHISFMRKFDHLFIIKFHIHICVSSTFQNMFHVMIFSGWVEESIINKIPLNMSKAFKEIYLHKIRNLFCTQSIIDIDFSLFISFYFFTIKCVHSEWGIEIANACLNWIWYRNNIHILVPTSVRGNSFVKWINNLRVK